MQLNHLTEQDTAIAELTQKIPTATSKLSNHLPWQHSQLLQVWCCEQWDLGPSVFSKSKEIATPLPFVEGVVRAAKMPRFCVCVCVYILFLYHCYTATIVKKMGAAHREGWLCSKKGGKGVNKQEWRVLRLAGIRQKVWSQIPGAQTIGEQWAHAWST